MSASERPDEDTRLWLAVTQNVERLHCKRKVLPTVPFDIAIRLPPHWGHTLDLHGMTMDNAYAAVLDFIQMSRHRYRFVTVVTGASGPIRQEFEHWVAGVSYVRRVEALPGGGAMRLHFRQTTSGSSLPTRRRT